MTLPLTDCTPPCGTKTYESVPCQRTIDRVCTPCHTSCQDCTSAQATACTACAPGFVFYTGPPPASQLCVPYQSCAYTAWSDWTACSLQCGGGVASRTRSLTNIWPCLNALPVRDLLACNVDACGTIWAGTVGRGEGLREGGGGRGPVGGDWRLWPPSGVSVCSDLRAGSSRPSGFQVDNAESDGCEPEKYRQGIILSTSRFWA